MSKKDWQLLKAYQATGLTPEGVTALQKELEWKQMCLELAQRTQTAVEQEFRDFTKKWYLEDNGFPCRFCKFHQEDGQCLSEDYKNSEDVCAGKFFEWRGVKEE